MQNKLNKNNSLMRIVLFGMILGPGIMLVSSVILAFIALKTGNPSGSVFPMALIAIFLGGFISSFRSTRVYNEKPLQAGFLTGLGNLLLVIVVSLISSTYSGGLWNAMTPPAVLLGSALLGMFFAGRIKPSAKRKLKKLRRQVR